MARLGVTYQDIAHAAEQIKAQGKQPTIELIRHLLGTGSTTTIANHLRQWRAEQANSVSGVIKENLPPEFISVMRGLWQRLKMHADEQVTAIKQESEQSMQHIRLEIEKYKTNNQRWQKMYDTWTKEKEKLAHAKLSLEKNNISLQTDNAALILKLEAQCQQTTEKQQRIEELHRLHKLAQENLEHYRESSRVQRLIDQEKHTQELQKISLNLKNTEQQLLLTAQTKTTLELQLNKMTEENTVLKKSNENINHQLSKFQSEFTALEKKHMEVKQQAIHWQEQHTALHKKLDFQDEMLIEQKKQNAVLAQQLSTANEEIKKWQDKNQLLAHEKWEIAQEKAQLEGINKQMQKMVSYKEVS